MGGSSAAGAIVSAGLSTWDQGNKYFNNEVNGPKAIGNIAAETSVGTVSAAAGLIATAGVTGYFTSIGALAGPVGFVAGAGIGLATDAAIRYTGADVWISETFGGAAESVANGVGSAWDWATDW